MSPVGQLGRLLGRLLENFVAAARHFSQTATRFEGDGSRRIADQPCRLKFRSGDRNRRAASSESACNRVLGEVQRALADAILHDEKPAAKPLNEGMAVIADSKIGDLGQ